MSDDNADRDSLTAQERWELNKQEIAEGWRKGIAEGDTRAQFYTAELEKYQAKADKARAKGKEGAARRCEKVVARMRKKLAELED